MKNAASQPVAPTAVDVRPTPGEPISLGARVGVVVSLAGGGVPSVDFPGNPHGPMVARLALPAAEAALLALQWKDAEVLLVFADHNIRQPVITGLVKNSLEDPRYQVADWEGFRQLFLRAQEELSLQCGEARIILRRDGKITIVGKEILSRAVGRHRIKGATVDIN